MYHSMRDLITNEIFRRVEPSGKTMGEYLKEEFETDFDIHIGVAKKDENRMHEMRNVTICRTHSDMSEPEDKRYSSFSKS